MKIQQTKSVLVALAFMVNFIHLSTALAETQDNSEVDKFLNYLKTEIFAEHNLPVLRKSQTDGSFSVNVSKIVSSYPIDNDELTLIELIEASMPLFAEYNRFSEQEALEDKKKANINQYYFDSYFTDKVRYFAKTFAVPLFPDDPSQTQSFKLVIDYFIMQGDRGEEIINAHLFWDRPDSKVVEEKRSKETERFLNYLKAKFFSDKYAISTLLKVQIEFSLSGNISGIVNAYRINNNKLTLIEVIEQSIPLAGEYHRLSKQEALQDQQKADINQYHLDVNVYGNRRKHKTDRVRYFSKIFELSPYPDDTNPYLIRPFELVIDSYKKLGETYETINAYFSVGHLSPRLEKKESAQVERFLSYLKTELFSGDPVSLKPLDKYEEDTDSFRSSRNVTASASWNISPIVRSYLPDNGLSLVELIEQIVPISDNYTSYSEEESLQDNKKTFGMSLSKYFEIPMTPSHQHLPLTTLFELEIDVYKKHGDRDWTIDAYLMQRYF